MAKKLTKAELLEMQRNFAEKLVEEKELEILTMSKTTELLNLKIKQLEVQAKMGSIDNTISKKKSDLELIKQTSRDFNNKMKIKYKLKDGWGINPDSGMILEEE
jgi:hypothetical protein